MTDTRSESRLLCSTRLSLAFLAFLGCAVMFSLRVNLSVAIVGMVNRTKDENSSYEASHSTSADECRRSNLEWNSSKTPATLENGEFSWDKKVKGSILGAFFWGYLFTQILGGWAAQRFGAKKIIMLNVCVSVLATLFTPLAARLHYAALMALRVLMGLVQGSMMPSVLVLWTRWAPPLERSRLTSFTFAGGQIGILISMPAAGVLCKYGFGGGWPSVFYVFGILGAIWSFAWFAFASDTPKSHRWISEKEKQHIRAASGEESETEPAHESITEVPWIAIFRSLPVWACFAAHFASDWGVYLLVTCLPLFLNEVLGFDVAKLGFIASVPYIVALVGMNLGGILADYLIKKECMSAVNVRKLMTIMSLCVPATCLVGAGHCQCGQETLAIVLLTLTAGLNSFRSSGYIVNYMEIAPRYSGLIVGVGNTITSIGGILIPVAMGALTPRHTRSEWLRLFYISASVLVAGCVTFCIFAKGEVQEWAKQSRGNSLRTLTKDEEMKRMVQK